MASSKPPNLSTAKASTVDSVGTRGSLGEAIEAVKGISGILLAGSELGHNLHPASLTVLHRSCESLIGRLQTIARHLGEVA